MRPCDGSNRRPCLPDRTTASYSTDRPTDFNARVKQLLKWKEKKEEEKNPTSVERRKIISASLSVKYEYFSLYIFPSLRSIDALTTDLDLKGDGCGMSCEPNPENCVVHLTEPWTWTLDLNPKCQPPSPRHQEGVVRRNCLIVDNPFAERRKTASEMQICL